MRAGRRHPEGGTGFGRGLRVAALVAAVLGQPLLAAAEPREPRPADGPPVEGLAEDSLRVRLTDAFSPFSEVVMELGSFGSAAALSLERRHPGEHGAERRSVLLDADAAARLVWRLQRCLDEHPPAPPGPDPAARSLEVTLGGGDDPVRIQEESGQSHPCMGVVRQALVQFESLLVYASPYQEEGEYGWLTVFGEGSHRVLLNGRESGARAPALRMRVLAGEHRVSLVDEQGAVVNEAHVRVEPAATTVVRLSR